MPTMKCRAIKFATNMPGRRASYLVMTSHAGRSMRTGARVHMSTLTVWDSGNVTVGATNCSANGHMHGTLVAGSQNGPTPGFDRVTCKNCGAGADAAAWREADAETLTLVAEYNGKLSLVTE